MSKTKFTPGPWSVRGSCFVAANSIDDGVIVARAYVLLPGYGCGNGNAALIAAAPEMYAFIEKVGRVFAGKSLSSEAEAILAKARGKS